MFEQGLFVSLSKYSADDIAEIRASGLFADDWYLTTYSDVGMIDIDPVDHYLWIGAEMGRDPSPRFSTDAYLADHPDVALHGANPLLHYLQTGQFENRRFRPSWQVRRWKPRRALCMPRKHLEPLLEKRARMIALYLPQFHPFPENDAWWGNDFTEWTNVRPAKPQFAGHYQPHVPHPDVGYYSLLDREQQRRQIEMAKCYGIEGFCFYYYWFSGHRLMETPIDNWLSDKSLDLPFCLCWANENWSRRWDGLESDILIAQNHSPEDDLGCIADLAKYIRDDRYIRINGKPLVLIYRPSLLPDPAATAARWRRWCRQNGVGEIYLAYTQSFENVDPSNYGFDAAIEFPPNNSNPPNLTDTVVPLTNEYAGSVYDWRVLVERSERFEYPDYKLFRSVCPGWDNTARRGNKGISLVNNTPELYQRWLQNAIRDTRLRFENPDERVIFVNAWNEWAEGAHLEPDLRNGYAYLEATRAALDPNPPPPRLGVVVHAFYPEVLDEILQSCDDIPDQFTYYVSTVASIADAVRATMEGQQRPFKLFVLPNLGRDVLPFLKVLAAMVADEVDYFAKVHTKRSLHREDGDIWRKELYNAVIGREAFCSSIAAMSDNPMIGMLGPDQHLVSMDTYLGSNIERIKKYARALEIDPETILDYSFFAGTMFIARTRALEPLLTVGIADHDFEEEDGQTDGTLAHAIERVITLCVFAGGYRVGVSNSPGGEAVVNSRYGFA